MFDSPFFDSVISMVALYLIFSQLTLSLVELPAGVVNSRGVYLYEHLLRALGTTAGKAFYASPAIQGLMLPGTMRLKKGNWPAYISETLFAQTITTYVCGLVPVSTPPPSAMGRFDAGLKSLEIPGAPAQAQQLAGLLRPLYTNAVATAATPPEQAQALQKNLEAWFHEFGERMSGWYKRDNRKYLFLAGLVVALLADVDTVRLTRFLTDANNAKARTALVELGVQAAQGARPADLAYQPGDTTAAAAYRRQQQATWGDLTDQASTNLKNTLAAVPQVGLPLGFVRWAQLAADSSYVARKDLKKILGDDFASGQPRPSAKADSVWIHQWRPTADDYHLPAYARRWHLNAYTGHISRPAGSWGWWGVLGGWLLTAFAMMLGAPFWFDTLCRFVNIRNVGIKPAKAPVAS